MNGMKIYLRLNEELTERFSKIKKTLGLKSNAEVLRTLINSYWREHQEELEEEKEQPS